MSAPPFTYFGGKMRLAPQLAALLPPHEHYVEPFAGSLAVLLARRPSRMETVNDLDGNLVTFWRVLRDRPDELARACSLTPHSRAEYLDSAELCGHDELETARRVWTHLGQSRTGTLLKTGWRHFVDPAGSSIGMPGYMAAYVDRMRTAAVRLQRVSLECRPASEMIAVYGQSPSVLLYVDPPYLGSTRPASGYVHEMRGETEHGDLLDQLLECRSSVVLSGYDSSLYRDALDGWDRVEIETSTGQGGPRQIRTEVVWSNRPISTPALFDAMPLGGAS